MLDGVLLDTLCSRLSDSLWRASETPRFDKICTLQREKFLPELLLVAM